MAKKLESFGSRVGDTLHIIKRDLFWKSFTATFKDGDRLKITIEKIYSKRSNQQNRYYFGVILPILLNEINEQGNEETKESLHELLINRFAKKKQIHNKDGEVIETSQRTQHMNKSEFSDYTFDVCRWAAEFWSCEIPEPNTQTKLF